MSNPLRNSLIAGLPMLGEALQSIPDEVVTAATSDNPWFNEATIKYSIDQISTWLQQDSLHSFLNLYPESAPISKRVGIIMAGNIPLVGFHDLLMVWLAGHQAIVKPSHQDTILMKWLIGEAVRVMPMVAKYVEITSMPADIDFLIATGSDNSARYIHHRYADVPHLLRKHRYSIGIIDQQTTPEDCEKLAYDLLLYHGLGCRNVTNLLVEEGVDVVTLLANCTLSDEYFSEQYFAKINREYARLSMLNRTPINYGQFLGTWRHEIAPSPLGVIHLIPFRSSDQKKALIHSYKNQLQCTVGGDIPYGFAQKPRLNDFADGVDSMKMLIKC